MKNRTFSWVMVLAVAFGTGAVLSYASASAESIAPTFQPILQRGTAAVLEVENGNKVEDIRYSSEKTDALGAWVLTMINKLAPEKHNEDFRHEIASDIATVSLSESPEAPAKAASVLVSLAFHEGRFREYVDSGLCNDKAWRKSKEGKATMLNGGDCDGGYAYSLWQIHPYESKITGKDLIRERRTAARVAWNYIKKNGWCGYSGEGFGQCPKAETRRLVAANYLAKHPFSL